MEVSHALKAGKEYSQLPISYVMMITDYDPFDRNRMVYTVVNKCVEEPDLHYNDGQVTLYLYVDGDPTDVPTELANLLQYMKSSTRENARDEKLKDLHTMVEAVKTSKEVQKSYMKFQELLQEAREDEYQKRIEAEQRAEQAEQEKQRAEQEKQQAEQRLDAEKRHAQDLQKEIDRLKSLLAGENA